VVNQTALNMTEGVGLLQQMGFFNLILPFAIFFLILFGILDKYKIVSKDRRINGVLALFISAFVLLYAYETNVELFFSQFYAKMSIAVLILLFAATLAIFVFRALKENEMIPAGNEKMWTAATVMGSVLIVQSAFSSAPGMIGEWAREVGGLVLTMGFIGSILSLFAGGGSGGKGEV